MKFQKQVILLLVPSIVLPIILLGWLAYVQLQNDAEDKTARQINKVIQQVETLWIAQLEMAKANIDLLANNKLITRYLLIDDEGERYELLQPSLLELLGNHQKNYPNHYEIRLLLADGYEDTRSTLALIPNVTEDEGENDYFKQMQRAPEDIYTTYFYNPDNHEYALLISKRITRQNKDIVPPLATPSLLGYLVATINMDFLRQQQQQYSQNMGIQLLFTNHEGRLLFDPFTGEHNSTLPASFFSLLKQRSSQQKLLPVKYDGKLNYARSRQLIDQLMVFALLQDSTLPATNRQLRLWVGAITLITALVASSLLFFRLRVIALKPLQKLNEATQQISQGNLAVNIEIHQKNEFGDLAVSFNTMSEHLQRFQQKIEQLAYYDSLTGLPNRRLFLEKVSQATAVNKRNSRKIAILFLDLDDFKPVNDTLGHEAGDVLLREVAERLINCTHAENNDSTGSELPFINDIVARLGGDEFIVLLSSLRNRNDAALVAQRILKVLSLPFAFQETKFHIGVSIGITVFPDDAENVDRLIRHADLAMYHAKQRGKNHYQFYSASMDAVVLEHLTQYVKPPAVPGD